MKYVGAEGIDMGSQKITSVADPTLADDAAIAGLASGVHNYGGATYDFDPTAKIYQKKTGDPATPTTVKGDIVLEQ